MKVGTLENAEVERRKVSEGADEDSQADYQSDRRERGRASLTGYPWELRHLSLKLVDFIARFHSFIARYQQSRN